MARISILSIIACLVTIVTSETNVETTNTTIDLETNWNSLYESLDFNSDGVISFNDARKSAKNFVERHGLTGKEAKEVKKVIKKLWKVHIFETLPSEVVTIRITKANFIARLSEQYSSDKDTFEKNMEDFFNDIFAVIDVNNDELISIEEYTLSDINAAVALFEPDNDVIPIADAVIAWVQFVTCESVECLNME